MDNQMQQTAKRFESHVFFVAEWNESGKVAQEDFRDFSQGRKFCKEKSKAGESVFLMPVNPLTHERLGQWVFDDGRLSWVDF